MDDAEPNSAPSLSKGVFVYKKSKVNSRKQKKVSKSEVGDLREEWQDIKDYFNAAWDLLKNEIQTVQNDCYRSIVANVTEFAKKVSMEKSQTAFFFNAVPTAAVILGVNMPDHSAVFTMLENDLQATVTPFVARVQSKDCSTIANMMQKIVHTIVKKKPLDEEVFRLKRHTCTFELLSTWYQLATSEKDCPSPTKRSRKVLSNEKKQVVIIIEDIESFRPSVLQDFILICNNYVTHFPLVLVLGVATAMVTVHNLLPQKVTSCLAIETFSSAPATEYLGKVYEKIIMNPFIPFKLGPEVFQMIVDITLFHDFSLGNLQHMLKLMLLEHFCSKKSAILCLTAKSTKITNDSLNPVVIEHIKGLPSVKKFLESSPLEGEQMLTSKKKFVTEIHNFSEELSRYQVDQDILLKCLHSVVADLPGYPLGKQVRDLYVFVLALEKPINEMAEYQKTLKLLCMLSREELKSKLLACIQVLQDMDSSKEVAFEEWLKKMESLLSALNKINFENSVDEEKVILSPINFGKRVSRAELKEKLKDLASKRKKMGKFEIWREDVVACWNEMFCKLKSPLSFPLHEAFYFTDVSLLRRHVLASPKASMHKVLVDPHSCLQCKCCKLEDLDDVKETLPPISILYKLHLESGNLINIYDWLQAYQAIRKNGQYRKNSEEILQAEFFQSLSELQLLGIIKPTKRKTDHVARLTWGYC